MDDRPLFFFPDARREALDAFHWYAQRSENAGKAYVTASLSSRTVCSPIMRRALPEGEHLAAGTTRPAQNELAGHADVIRSGSLQVGACTPSDAGMERSTTS